MSFGSFEVHAGDFKKGNDHQFLKDVFIMKSERRFFREKIPMAQVEELEVASEESVKRLGGAVGWGIAGAALLGPVGLLAGLLGGGKGKNVTFVCRLKDGRKFLGTAKSKVYTEMAAANF